MPYLKSVHNIVIFCYIIRYTFLVVILTESGAISAESNKRDTTDGQTEGEIQQQVQSCVDLIEAGETRAERSAALNTLLEMTMQGIAVHKYAQTQSPHSSLAVMSPMPLRIDGNGNAQSLFVVLELCAGDYGIADSHTEEIIVSLFKTNDACIRSISLFMSVYIDSKLAVAMSRQALRDPEPEVRAAAIVVANWVASSGTVMRKEALEVVFAGLDDRDLRVRQATEALWALPIQPSVPKFWEYGLVRQLADRDISTRIRALRYLAAIEGRTCNEITAVKSVVVDSQKAFVFDNDIIANALLLALTMKDGKNAVREIWGQVVATKYVDSDIASVVEAYLAGDANGAKKITEHIGNIQLSVCARKLSTVMLAKLITQNAASPETFSPIMRDADMAIKFLESLDTSKLAPRIRETLLTDIISSEDGFVRLYGQCILNTHPEMIIVNTHDISDVLNYEMSDGDARPTRELREWLLSVASVGSIKLREHLRGELTALICREVKDDVPYRLLTTLRFAKGFSHRHGRVDGAKEALILLLSRQSLGLGIRGEAFAIAEPLVPESEELRDLCWQEIQRGTSTQKYFALQALSRPFDIDTKK